MGTVINYLAKKAIKRAVKSITAAKETIANLDIDEMSESIKETAGKIVSDAEKLIVDIKKEAEASKSFKMTYQFDNETERVSIASDKEENKFFICFINKKKGSVKSVETVEVDDVDKYKTSIDIEEDKVNVNFERII